MNRMLNRSLRRLLSGAAVLALLPCLAAQATNLTGTFKNPDGSPVNGKLIFLLSQPARINDNSAQVVPMVKIFSVTNGALEAGAFLFGNDVLVPSGTYYVVRLVDANNNLLFEQKWSIQGTNLDLGSLTPTTTGVVLPDPLIKNVTTSQSVTGPVTFSGGVTAFSLTLNGNLNPGAANAYDLGSPAAPWREVHAQRTNEHFRPGTVSGLVTPPAAAPQISQEGSTGIANGSYSFKMSYRNLNGETTVSPCTDFAVTGGPRLVVAQIPGTELNWYTGAFGFRIFAGNGTCASAPTFYQQTPRNLSVAAAAIGTSMTVTSAVRTSNVTVITVSASLGTEFQVGRPVVMAGNDASFNGTFRILSIGGDGSVASATKFSYYNSGTDGTSAANGTAQVPSAASDGTVMYFRTAANSLFTGKSVTTSGYGNASFNLTAPVREVIDNQTFTVTNALAATTTSGGNAAWKAGLDNFAGAHWIAGFYIMDTLTFSGTTIPIINTATIDPAQVALNTACPVAAFSACQGVLVLPQGQTNLTTPLIVPYMRKAVGPAKQNQDTAAGNPTLNCPFTDPELACVMAINSQAGSWEGFNITSTGHGLMLLGTARDMNFKNGVIRTTSTAANRAAVRIFIGTASMFSVNFEDVLMNGDRSVVWVSSTTGTNLRFRGSRWNCGSTLTTFPGSSAFLNESGAEDFDRNVRSVSGSISFVQIHDAFMETCTGIVGDFRNTGIDLRDWFPADGVPIAGTLAALRWSADSFASGDSAFANTLSHVTIENKTNYFSAVAFTEQTSNTINNVQLENVNSANTIVVNFNGLTSIPVSIRSSSQAAGFNAYSAATSGKVINQASAYSHFTCLGCAPATDTQSRIANNVLWGGLLLTPVNNPAINATFDWGNPGAGNLGGGIELNMYYGDPQVTASRRFRYGDGATVSSCFYDSDGTTLLLCADTTAHSVRFGNNPASNGFVGLSPNNVVSWRNNAGSGNLRTFERDASDRMIYGEGSGDAFYPRTSGQSLGLSTNRWGGLFVNNQIDSTLATGTAPLAVASTTEVTNLNAQQWHGKQAIDFSATLDFPSIAAQTCSTLTITATGAAANNPVAPSWPTGLETGLAGMMHVTSANTVTVRLCNVTVAAIDPANQTFAGRVMQ